MPPFHKNATMLPSEAHTRTGFKIAVPALELLRKEYPMNIRLMGLRMSNLERIGGQKPPPDQHTVDDFFKAPER